VIVSVEAPLTELFTTNHQLALVVSVAHHQSIVTVQAVLHVIFTAILTLVPVLVKSCVRVAVFHGVCSAQLSVIVHPVHTVHHVESAQLGLANNSLAGLNNQSQSITSMYHQFLSPIALVQYVIQFTHLKLSHGTAEYKAPHQSSSPSHSSEPLYVSDVSIFLS
jgi:hypothetical protein